MFPRSSLFFVLVLSLVFLGVGCKPQAADKMDDTTAQQNNYEASARVQTANREVSELLIQLGKNGVDVKAFRDRWGKATYQSASNLTEAADLMEKLRDDLKAELAK